MRPSRRIFGSVATSTVALLTVSMSTVLAATPAVAQPFAPQSPITVPTETGKAAPTAYSAGSKPVGAVTNAWGRFDTAEPITAWTEALVNGNWSRSQTVTTTATGNYTIPLTYGATTPGTHTFRVRGQ
ncbi:MAG: hypothetical protein GXX86_06900, partial [Propionibacterium sp.]|nr:hypothetical protein [Propionibacterium sp.]